MLFKFKQNKTPQILFAKFLFQANVACSKLATMANVLRYQMAFDGYQMFCNVT